MSLGAYEQQLKELKESRGDDNILDYLQDLRTFVGTKYADSLKLTERYIYKERFVKVGEDIPEEVFILNFVINEKLLLAKELGVLNKIVFGKTSDKLKLDDFLLAHAGEKIEQSKLELSTETQTEQEEKLRFLIKARRLYLPKSFPANHRGLKFPRGKSGTSTKLSTSEKFIKYETPEYNEKAANKDESNKPDEWGDFLVGMCLLFFLWIIIAWISSVF